MAIAAPSATNVDSTRPVPSRPKVVSSTPDAASVLTSVAAINAAESAIRDTHLFRPNTPRHAERGRRS